ncbi:MAG: branched-chain amino acid ABC transporter substrate-binding protein [Burkholderiales bacterium PBB5]|nr:MAG: branched-chain amino acid ABC transporter substrate-binding protein [Burkholderiales bacterium PBB5]
MASLASPAQAQTAAAGKPSCGLNTGKKASGEPIAIGAVVGKTGPDDFSASSTAAAAYFKCVNDNGGINGRPVDYLVADDQWNPETATQVAGKLVRDRKVLAMVGSSSFVECGANAKLYEQEGVMVIAGVGVPRECFFAKNYAPVNTGPRVSATLVATHMAQAYKARKMVCIIPNIPSLGNWACEGAKGWGASKGVVVETITIDPGSADATSVMLQAAAAKPDVILLNVPKGIMVPMLAAAEQQGLHKKIKFASTTPAYNADVPKTIGKAWDNNFDLHLEFMPVESGGPDNSNWKAVMAAYADKSAPRDSFAQSGYLAARIATEALLKLDAKTLDRAKVTAALRQVKGFKSDILCKPFYVGDGARHNANSSGPIAQVSAGGFKLIGQGCMTADEPELADVRADEKRLGL